jgi:hypothetical protein
MWTGLVCLRTGTGGELVASRVVLSSIELVQLVIVFLLDFSNFFKQSVELTCNEYGIFQSGIISND